MALGLWQPTVTTFPNIERVRACRPCSRVRRAMECPWPWAPVHPTPNRLPSVPAIDRTIFIKVTQVLCLGNPFQVVSSIVTLVQIFVIHMRWTKTWWWTKKWECYQPMHCNGSSWYPSASYTCEVVAWPLQCPFANRSCFGCHTAKGTHHSIRHLITRSWIQHGPPLFASQSRWACILKLYLKFSTWCLSVTYRWHHRSCQPKLLCSLSARRTKCPLLCSTPPPHHRFGNCGSIAPSALAGIGMQHILTWGYVIQIVKPIIHRVTILVMHLPSLLILGRSIKSKHNNPMNKPILPTYFDQSYTHLDDDILQIWHRMSCSSDHQNSPASPCWDFAMANWRSFWVQMETHNGFHGKKFAIHALKLRNPGSWVKPTIYTPDHVKPGINPLMTLVRNKHDTWPGPSGKKTHIISMPSRYDVVPFKSQ